MLELNRRAEVALHAQAADMEWTLERQGPNRWVMLIEGVPDENLAKGDDSTPMEQLTARPRQEFVLNDAQAAVTMALFIGDDAIPYEDIVKEMYEIAETVWKDVPQHFRPIL